MRLHEQILLPVAKLASSIQQSSSQYEFYPHMPSSPFLNYQAVVIEDLNYISVIDVSTRKTLKPDSPVVSQEDGKIGYPILLLEPSLARTNSGTNNSTLLRRSVYLIQLAKPMRKRNQAAVGRP